MFISVIQETTSNYVSIQEEQSISLAEMKTLFLLFALGFICLEASQQSVAVNGWIRCKDKYLGGIVSVLD